MLLAMAALSWIAAACDEPPTDGGPSDSNGGQGGSGGDQGGSGGVPIPIFEDDVVPIFVQRCGSAVSDCHSRVVYRPQAATGCRSRISFEDATLGAVLYGPPNGGSATGCPDRTLLERLLEGEVEQCGATSRYLVPCSLEDSYIARKIAGGPYCLDGTGATTKAMPPGVPLDDDTLSTLLRWIGHGAPTASSPAPVCGEL